MIGRREFLRASAALGGLLVAGSAKAARAARRTSGTGAGIAHLYADLHSDSYFEGPVRIETRLAGTALW